MLPAYEFCMKSSHAFNSLDARGAISVTERQRFIGRVRGDGEARAPRRTSQNRAQLGFPLLPNAAAARRRRTRSTASARPASTQVRSPRRASSSRTPQELPHAG